VVNDVNERSQRVFKQLLTVSRVEVPNGITVVSDIGGSSLQAIAFHDSVQITRRAAGIMDDDELAFVLGHEIAHIEGGHWFDEEKWRSHGREKAEEYLSKLDSDAGFFTTLFASVLSGVAAGVVVGLGALHESRENELAADRRALEIMAQAGYDVHKAPSGLIKITSDASGRATFLEQLRSTHPETAERVERMQEAIEEMG
jgi:Zn-dependent protease with chaperone function